MLSKEVCKKCQRANWTWDAYDEEYWNSGLVFCSILWREDNIKSTRSIKLPPPSNCPYKLEHIISKIPQKQHTDRKSVV